MYTLEELKQQNEDISQLCDVLSVLMENTSLHDNSYVEELMTRFKEKVWMHLVFEDNTIYVGMLTSDNGTVRDAAKKFHNSAHEIKHLFTKFVKHWRHMDVADDEHEPLCKDCRKVFTMIRERIEFENTQIFPLIS
jgi:hypothetical protein